MRNREKLPPEMRWRPRAPNLATVDDPAWRRQRSEWLNMVYGIRWTIFTRGLDRLRELAGGK
jgi:hypothetical protein